MSRRLGAALWVVGVVGFLLLEAFCAAAYPNDYSYTYDYISDLGVRGPRVRVMHLAFYLQGIMFLLGTLFLTRGPRSCTARLFVGLVAANTVGNILVGTLHSGKVHVVGAALALAGGNAAILAGSAVIGPTRRWYRSTSTIIAALGFLCLAMLAANLHILPTGVVERGSAYSIFLWQLMTAACLLRPRGESAITSR